MVVAMVALLLATMAAITPMGETTTMATTVVMVALPEETMAATMLTEEMTTEATTVATAALLQVTVATGTMLLLVVIMSLANVHLFSMIPPSVDI